MVPATASKYWPIIEIRISTVIVAGWGLYIHDIFVPRCTGGVGLLLIVTVSCNYKDLFNHYLCFNFVYFRLVILEVALEVSHCHRKSHSFIIYRAMRKRGLLSPGVCPSVCPSVTLVYCIHTAEDIVKLLSRPSSPIILVF